MIETLHLLVLLIMQVIYKLAHTIVVPRPVVEGFPDMQDRKLASLLPGPRRTCFYPPLRKTDSCTTASDESPLWHGKPTRNTLANPSGIEHACGLAGAAIIAEGLDGQVGTSSDALQQLTGTQDGTTSLAFD